MQLRIFLYKPSDFVREPLVDFLEELGHEVAVIDFPQVCLQYHSPGQNCSAKIVCADSIILGDGISPEEGLLMLERRVAASCPGAKKNAIIYDKLSDDERHCAENIGCKMFKKPLDLADVGVWLDEVLQNLDKERELSPFTIGGTSEMLKVRAVE